jgi:hypothetical protein
VNDHDAIVMALLEWRDSIERVRPQDYLDYEILDDAASAIILLSRRETA